MHTRFLLCLIVGICSMGPAVHAAASEAERIRELEKENDQLRQELAGLRLELSQLKKKLAAQAPEPAAEKPQTPAKGVPSDTDPADADSADADQPGEAEQPEQKRTYRSADEIYRSIPAELSPKREGWDVFTRTAVADWFKQTIPGHRYQARHTIRHIELRRDYLNTDQWNLTLQYEYKPMRFMGWDMHERLANTVLSGDLALIKKKQKQYRVGGKVTVAGTIRHAQWDLAIIQKPDANWHPTHCSISLEDVQLR